MLPDPDTLHVGPDPYTLHVGPDPDLIHVGFHLHLIMVGPIHSILVAHDLDPNNV